MDRGSMHEHLDIDRLQKIQDNCSTAAGIASVTVDYRGVPITRYSGFTPFCERVRSLPEFASRCEQCDAHGGLRSTMTGEPCIYHCHAGLVDLAVPLVVNGSYVGAVIGGQVRLAEESDGNDLDYVIPQRTDFSGHPELEELYEHVPTTTYERLDATVLTLQELLRCTLGQAEGAEGDANSAALQKTSRELKAARDTVDDLESVMRKRESVDRRRDEVLSLQNFCMNTIHCVAASEGARRTDSVALDYADVSRYILDTDRVVVELGEETDFVSALLFLYKAWYGDALTFSVEVPEPVRSAMCPFMTIYPIIQAVLKGFSGADGTPCSITLSAAREGEGVLVSIVENRLSELEMADAFEDSNEGGRFTLEGADRYLSRMTQGASSIRATSMPDGSRGACISFRLPIARG